MRTIWIGAQWVGRKLIFTASLVVGTLMLLLLPAMVVMKGRLENGRIVTEGFAINLGRYWGVVGQHLAHLVKGELGTPGVNALRPDNLPPVVDQLATALPITLQLNGLALLFSLVLGLGLGVLLSVAAPRWLRAPFWGATSVLYSLPDLVIASFMQLAFLFVAMVRGTGPTRGSEAWQHLWAPVIALTLILTPYIARVTATAIDEISGQHFIRAAVARGTGPVRILLKHIGKNVLLRVSSILPVVAGLLVSSGAVVEYMSELRGVGRSLIMTAGGRGFDPYDALIYAFPLLLLFTVFLALSELLQRLLDPRITADGGDAKGAPIRRLGRPSLQGLVSGLVGLGRWLRSIPAGLLGWLVRLPGGLKRALRSPGVVVGVILVAGLIVVAILAPSIAPHDPAQRMPAAMVMPDGRILVPPLKPSIEHLLGTDSLGRDIFSRLLFGTRYAILLAMLVAPVRFLLAVPFGLVAAYRGGVWSKALHWFSTLFTALPHFIIPLALIRPLNNVFEGRPGAALFWGVLVVALPGVPRLAGSVQRQAAEVLALPMVEGAYAVGAGTTRTLFRYILPQLLPQLSTMLALEIPSILTTTALLGYFRAFVGGSVFIEDPPEILPLLPEWGATMQNPVMLLLAGRWWDWAPYFALMVAVLAFNLLGEGARKLLGTRTDWRWRG